MKVAAAAGIEVLPSSFPVLLLLLLTLLWMKQMDGWRYGTTLLILCFDGRRKAGTCKKNKNSPSMKWMRCFFVVVVLQPITRNQSKVLGQHQPTNTIGR